MQSCESVWSDAIKYKVNEAANKMEKLYGDLFDLRQDFSIYKEAKSYYDDTTDFDQILDQAAQIKRSREVNIARQKSEELKAAKSRVKGDEDIIIEETNAPVGILCPLSNTLPVHPVVSRKCKHVYDKEHIVNYIQSRTNGRNISVPCPMAGCSANITLNDLYEDPEITKKVNEARRSQTQNDDYEEL